ncbi:unnamed protein product [Closterium sp. Naga37s-1]|nr:unnamed protein product [Closterium sp. Naga37s-1]
MNASAESLGPLPSPRSSSDFLVDSKAFPLFPRFPPIVSPAHQNASADSLARTPSSSPLSPIPRSSLLPLSPSPPSPPSPPFSPPPFSHFPERHAENLARKFGLDPLCSPLPPIRSPFPFSFPPFSFPPFLPTTFLPLPRTPVLKISLAIFGVLRDFVDLFKKNLVEYEKKKKAEEEAAKDFADQFPSLFPYPFPVLPPQSLEC